MTIIIDGKKIAEGIKAEIKREISIAKEKPGLSVILVGNNPASEIYVKNKQKTAEELGMTFALHRFEETETEEKILALIEKLNKDEKIDGILIQLPLPKHLNTERLTSSVAPEKDVDGLTPVNIGKMILKQNTLIPCTAAGIVHLIKTVKPDITGLNALVIGRSNIVGKPTAQLLLNENCTLTVAHSKTKDIPSLCKQADILVVAIGDPMFIKGDWIKQGAVVIDVGINRGFKEKLCGDVDFNAAKDKAYAITPVPGGVGPMTMAMLFKNTLKAFKERRNNGKE